MRKKIKKIEIAKAVAKEFVQFNEESPKWEVQDKFELDGKTFSIRRLAHA